MVKRVNISEMIKEMQPVWAKFIKGLGYSEEEAQRFAEGYAEEVGKLPALGKMEAIYNQNDACMNAGFAKAGINPAEAWNRAHPPI